MNFDSYITSGTKTALTISTTNGQKQLNPKKGAFTLAETLITLTIIGVIAALTIPTLISKYQKHTYVVGLKKAYSQLQNAMKMIPITQGCPAGDYDCAGWNKLHSSFDSSITDSNITFTDENEYRTWLISKQFKINKFCGKNNIEDCITNSMFIKEQGEEPQAVGGAFVAEDGSVFRSTYGAGYDVMLLIVDTNGAKGPNKVGRDIFWFNIVNNNSNIKPQGTIIPCGSKLATSTTICSAYWKDSNTCTTENVTKNRYGSDACTGRVLEEDAMNY